MSKKRKIYNLLTLILCTVATFTIQIMAYDVPSTTVRIHGDFEDWLELANGDPEYNWHIVFPDGSSFGYDANLNPDACQYSNGTEYYDYNGVSQSFAYVCSSYTAYNTEVVSAPLYITIYQGTVEVEGIQTAVQNAYNNGYNTAYTLGYTDGSNAQVEADNAGRNLIVATVEAPFNVLMNMLNFEILGINIFGIVAGIFTLMLVGVIIKKVVL